MANKQVGSDISCELGKVDSIEKIDAVFEQYLDDKHLSRMDRQVNFDVRKKIANAIAICKPKAVFINTGTPEDRTFIRKLALERGEESPLAMANHTIHFDLEKEQGRILDRTFYIADEWEDISSLAQRMDRETALKDIAANMEGIMADMTMIVGFYIRGPVGAPMSNPALEITSSAYVAHSAEILYRNAFDHFNAEVERLGYFFTNLHSQGLNRTEDLPQARVFMDRS